MISLYYVRILRKKSDGEEVYFEGILEKEFIVAILEKYGGNITFIITIHPWDQAMELKDDSLCKMRTEEIILEDQED